MKIQVKFDKATMQNFFVGHGEKVAFAVVVILAVLIGYFGPGRGEPFTRTPKNLYDSVSTVRNVIDRAVPPKDLKVPDYVRKVKSSSIDDGPYATHFPFNPPIFEARQVRGEPQTYTVELLRGSGEIAAFMVVPAPAKGPLAGAENTGPATSGSARPAPAQPAAARPTTTREAFDSAAKDRRSGLGSFGRRTAGEDGRPLVATAGSQPQGRIWVSLVGLVPLRKQRDAYRDSFRNALGYDPRRDFVWYAGYQVQRLEISSPGDAVNPDWAKATLIDSLKSKPALEATRQWSTQSQGLPEVVDAKYLEGVDPLVFPLGPLAPGRFWGASVAHEPEIPLRFSAIAAPQGGLLRATTAPGMPDVKPPDYRLFRFLDFGAEPGKRYMYRVRLTLVNPNHGCRPAILSHAEFAEKVYLQTEWSKPSGLVAVPADTGLLLASVTPPTTTTRSGESSATVLVTKWVMDKGTEERRKESLVRGQVANFSTQPAAKATSTDRPDFATDTLAVDFRGDERLVKKEHNASEPGEILLLTADGNLFVRDEIDDARTGAGVAPPRPPARTELAPRPGPPPRGSALERADEEKAAAKGRARHNAPGPPGARP